MGGFFWGDFSGGRVPAGFYRGSPSAFGRFPPPLLFCGFLLSVVSSGGVGWFGAHRPFFREGQHDPRFMAAALWSVSGFLAFVLAARAECCRTALRAERHHCACALFVRFHTCCGRHSSRYLLPLSDGLSEPHRPTPPSFCVLHLAFCGCSGVSAPCPPLAFARPPFARGPCPHRFASGPDATRCPGVIITDNLFVGLRYVGGYSKRSW